MGLQEVQVETGLDDAFVATAQLRDQVAAMVGIPAVIVATVWRSALIRLSSATGRVASRIRRVRPGR